VLYSLAVYIHISDYHNVRIFTARLKSIKNSVCACTIFVQRSGGDIAHSGRLRLAEKCGSESAIPDQFARARFRGASCLEERGGLIRVSLRFSLFVSLIYPVNLKLSVKMKLVVLH